jgi:hypothetical protein
MKMNSEYFVALARTFEKRYGVTFQASPTGRSQTRATVSFNTRPTSTSSCRCSTRTPRRLAGRSPGRTRRVAARRSAAAALGGGGSVPRRSAAGEESAGRVPEGHRNEPGVGATKEVGITLFRKAGEIAGTRRAISEIVKWLNYVTGNRMVTAAADLSESINLEHGSIWGHYDPETNPARHAHQGGDSGGWQRVDGDRMVSQSARSIPTVRRRLGDQWHLRRVHATDVHPGRVWSQQSQDSKFRMGVLHILVGHSGPETAADGRTHFGIFAPQVWKLFPRGQVIHLNFWDYNDVAPAYFAAAEIAAREAKVGIITLEVARPDFPSPIARPSQTPTCSPPRKGFYVIRDFAPGQPKHGYVITQGSSSTVNLVSQLPALEAAGVNVKVIAAISEELFDRQPESYRNAVLPPEALYDLMIVSTGTRRVWPLKAVGPLTDEYSLTSDWDNHWLTGGLEPDVIAEAHLDAPSILAGIKRFAADRDQRLTRQRKTVGIVERTLQRARRPARLKPPLYEMTRSSAGNDQNSRMPAATRPAPI